MKIIPLSVLITVGICSCAAQTVAPVKCGPNETYDKCGSSCPETCYTMRKPPQVCIQKCSVGCFCNLGYVRNALGKCVPTGECWKEVLPVGKV